MSKVNVSSNTKERKQPKTYRDVACPVIERGDSTNPRHSKLYGMVPFHPKEQIPNSTDEKQTFLSVQFYIPSMPEFFQSLIPLQYKTGLLVMKCYKVIFYCEDELDSLVYVPPTLSDHQPKLITSWYCGVEKDPRVPDEPNDNKFLVPLLNRNKYQLGGFWEREPHSSGYTLHYECIENDGTQKLFRVQPVISRHWGTPLNVFLVFHPSKGFGCQYFAFCPGSGVNIRVGPQYPPDTDFRQFFGQFIEFSDDPGITNVKSTNKRPRCPSDSYEIGPKRVYGRCKSFYFNEASRP